MTFIKLTQSGNHQHSQTTIITGNQAVRFNQTGVNHSGSVFNSGHHQVRQNQNQHHSNNYERPQARHNENRNDRNDGISLRRLGSIARDLKDGYIDNPRNMKAIQNNEFYKDFADSMTEDRGYRDNNFDNRYDGRRYDNYRYDEPVRYNNNSAAPGVSLNLDGRKDVRGNVGKTDFDVHQEPTLVDRINNFARGVEGVGKVIEKGRELGDRFRNLGDKISSNFKSEPAQQATSPVYTPAQPTPVQQAPVYAIKKEGFKLAPMTEEKALLDFDNSLAKPASEAPAMTFVPNTTGRRENGMGKMVPTAKAPALDLSTVGSVDTPFFTATDLTNDELVAAN